MKEKTYISYLTEKYDKRFILAPSRSLNSNSIINKPKFCLWASPSNAHYGWIEFCTCNDLLHLMGTIKFSFKLSPKAKIFIINNINDINKVPFYGNGDIFIDFDKLREDGYDGMELTDPRIGHYFINKKEECFNCWDCESIAIWNPDTIIPI